MVFSLRQLQEKCREQQIPLYIAFIDLSKAFDLVSRDCPFRVHPKIGCPPKLPSMIESFHTDTKGTVQFNGSSSEPFEIRCGVKQGCVLAPTLFGIFFGLLLKHAFDKTTEGMYLRTRSEDRLFNLARLRAKTKLREVLIRDMLFADDAAVVAHAQEELQWLVDCFSQSEEDECPRTGYISTAGHYHRRLWTRCCLPIHLPRLHHHWQPHFGCRCQQEDWEGSFNSRPSHGSKVDKPQSVCEGKYGSLQCQCYQHIAVWQRDADYICRSGEKAQHIPPEEHPPYPGNILAG